mmetsp:Transcript_28958/g.42053  ORF Transcript_28958/g.42053 Transcript_28958/m.42053 type:complete len:389 (+) Transcript_28958:1233-2399(+)
MALVFLRHRVRQILRTFCTDDIKSLEALSLPITPPQNDDSGSTDTEFLPAWCRIDIGKYNENRSQLRRWILGEKRVNRHEALFYFERYGVGFTLFAFQLIFVVVVFQTAIIIYAFWINLNNLDLRALYIVLSVIPSLITYWLVRNTLPDVAEISSIGVFRSEWAISETIRERKISGIVRTFVVIYKMRRAAKLNFTSERQKKKVGEQKQFSDSFDYHEQVEIRETFRAFDVDQSGQLSNENLKHIMARVGVPMSESQLSTLVGEMDIDGNGEVSEEDFLQWYRKHLEEEVDSNEFFEMLDRSGSGVITLTDLKAYVDTFHLNFTVFDLASLIGEIDRDGDGRISENEIDELLETFAPRELASREKSCTWYFFYPFRKIDEAKNWLADR